MDYNIDPCKGWKSTDPGFSSEGKLSIFHSNAMRLTSDSISFKLQDIAENLTSLLISRVYRRSKALDWSIPPSLLVLSHLMGKTKKP